MDLDDRDDIAELIADHVPADEIARRLILPLNDVLTVVQELRLADTPPPNRTGAVQPAAVRRPPVVAVPAQERAPMPSPLDVPSRTEAAADKADLFSRAEAIDDKRIAKALDAAKKATAALTELVEKHERTAEVRARITELEEQLAAERAKLQPAKRAAAEGRSGADGDTAPAARDVRAWAERNGVAVPEKGPVPKAVVEQYLAAPATA
jgi:hypothetical protein